MVITFTNKHGTLRLNGGGTNHAWRILEISGIGLPNRTFTYHQYAGVVGQTLNAVSMPNRTITISGDITESARRMSLAGIMRMLYEDGELRIQTGNKIRRAFVRTLSFDPDQRKDTFRKFTWQLESDNPFFYGPKKVKYNVYQRTAKLTSPFTLPTVFSERLMSAAIINSGDAAAEPVITISKSPLSETTASTLTLRLETGEDFTTEIVLDYTISSGEAITVDIPNRKIISSLNGSIISSLALGSVLHAFTVPPGCSFMSVETADTSLTVTCEFENQYVEASHDE